MTAPSNQSTNLAALAFTPVPHPRYLELLHAARQKYLTDESVQRQQETIQRRRTWAQLDPLSPEQLESQARQRLETCATLLADFHWDIERPILRAMQAS